MKPLRITSIIPLGALCAQLRRQLGHLAETNPAAGDTAEDMLAATLSDWAVMRAVDSRIAAASDDPDDAGGGMTRSDWLSEIRPYCEHGYTPAKEG